MRARCVGASSIVLSSLVAASLALPLFGCQIRQRGSDEEMLAAQADRLPVDCDAMPPLARLFSIPESQVLVWRAASLRLIMGRPIAQANEDHDCQRLMHQTPSGYAYDSVAALWVIARLDTLSVPYLDTARFIAGVVMQGGSYASLALDPGSNCLFVQADSTSTNVTWTAWMAHTGRKHCATLDSLPAKAHQLPATCFKANLRLPPAGRWEWNAAADSNFLGILVGKYWCAIGYAGISIPYPEQDEQMLAYADGHGRLRPSGMVGRIIPDSGWISSGDSVKATWGPVGTIVLEGDTALAIGKYRAKYGLHAGINTIQIRKDSVAGYQVEFNGDSTSIHHATWHQAHHSGPGTLRWGWSENDETVWVQCSNGCCSVN